MEGVQKDLRVQKLNKEVSCDYVLPDFKGDIKKVLCVRVCATPLSKVCADNRLEFNGIVNYNLLKLL